VIEKSGAWYTFEGDRMGQGRENARQFLKDNPDIRTEVDTRLRKGLGLPVIEKEAAPRTDKAAVLPMPEKKKA
jgi:recombination protein RecA